MKLILAQEVEGGVERVARRRAAVGDLAVDDPLDRAVIRRWRLCRVGLQREGDDAELRAARELLEERVRRVLRRL